MRIRGLRFCQLSQMLYFFYFYLFLWLWKHFMDTYKMSLSIMLKMNIASSPNFVERDAAYFVGLHSSGRNGLTTSKMSMKEENMGAAKRMFANALGIQAPKDGVSRGK